MLRIVDKHNRVRWILRDQDEEPISIDELILNDRDSDEAQEEENIDAEKNTNK